MGRSTFINVYIWNITLVSGDFLLDLQKSEIFINMIKDNTKLEILEINLTSLKDEDYKEGLIHVDEPTFNFFLRKLERDESYEDCSLLVKNKKKLLFP